MTIQLLEVPDGEKVTIRYLKGTIRAVIVGYTKKGKPRVRALLMSTGGKYNFARARAIDETDIVKRGWGKLLFR